METPADGTNRPAFFDNAWFGYLGYGLKNSLEKLAADRPNWLALPNLCLMRFHTVYRFDHDERRVDFWSDVPGTKPLMPMSQSDIAAPTVMSPALQYDTRTAYLSKAAEIIERIHAGDLYQANLTRKFTGEFSQPPDAFGLFRRLCEASPAPYSAFLKLGDTQILSSSPELFLHIDAAGQVRTRPIKGTAAAIYKDAGAGPTNRADALAASAKDRAENLMIVDLMRNDFSRACLPGSVQGRKPCSR